MIKIRSSAGVSGVTPTYKDVESILGGGLEVQLKYAGRSNMRYKEYNGSIGFSDDKAEFKWITQEPFDEADANVFVELISERVHRLCEKFPSLKSVKVVFYLRDDRNNKKRWERWMFVPDRSGEALMVKMFEVQE